MRYRHTVCLKMNGGRKCALPNHHSHFSIEGHSGWEIVAEVSNGRDAVAKAKLTNPHIAVLDISMPLLNGLEAARQISKSGLQTQVLILTMHESDRLITQVLEAGATGFVLKSDAGRDFVSAIDALSGC